MGTLHCWVSMAEKKKETLLAFNHGQAFDGAPHLGDPSQAGWFFCRRNSWKLPSSGIYYHFGNPFTCPILRGQFTHRGPSFQEGTVPRRSATRKWLLLPPPPPNGDLAGFPAPRYSQLRPLRQSCHHAEVHKHPGPKLAVPTRPVPLN